jgi:glycyl-tRNA synthetase beta chain
MADFLLEMGLEEVPARMIAGAEAELGQRVSELLTRERLLGASGKVTTYSTPRRLAVLVEDVLAKQADAQESLVGPSWGVAFKDGVPTKAAEAFAKKAGVVVADLKKVTVLNREAVRIEGFAPFNAASATQYGILSWGDPGITIESMAEKSGIDLNALRKITNATGEYALAAVHRRGRAAAELLVAELPKEVASIYWAKNMYWRAGKPERFVRPVRWVVVLLDSAIVPVEIAGIVAGNASRGHRVLYGEAPVVLAKAAGYKEALRKAFVMVDVVERRQSIRKALDAVTRTVAGAKWREDETLIETVVHLTEWPSVVLGDFEAEYLKLPEKVLVTVMRDHQKYFAVESADGKLAPHFLAVLNTQVGDEGLAIIRHGNARVLRARFKDARFFWDFDQKIPLTERDGMLFHVTFQKKLGSYHEKVDRISRILPNLVNRMPPIEPKVDEASLLQAAKICKSDLTCELVKEFTELQGVIGGLYAEAQSLGGKVSEAIRDQYKPTSAEDTIPSTMEGCLLSIADKADTIAGMFAIGEEPTGTRDPFALRRAGNGIIKILAEWHGSLNRSLNLLSEESVHFHQNVIVYWEGKEAKEIHVDQSFVSKRVLAFFQERLHFYLKDVRGYAYDVANAVLAAGADDVRDAIARAEALTEVRGSEDFRAISAAFKRIKNILRQAEEKGFAIQAAAGVVLSAEAQQLADAAAALAPEVALLRQERAYSEALALIATLRPAVDAFFDKVMVLDPDPAIRGAHLGLIDEVLRGFSGIADFSEIVTA